MGKLGLLIVASVLVSSGYLLFTSASLDKATSASQSERQVNLIVREIAQSGLNDMEARAMEEEENGSWDDLLEFLSDTGFNAADGDTLVREMEGGRYKAWVEQASAISYNIVSVGEYDFVNDRGTMETVTYETVLTSLVPVSDDDDDGDGCTTVLCVPDQPEDPDDDGEDDNGTCESTGQYELHAEFIESMAGWCSGIYLEMYIPDNSEPTGYRKEIGTVFDPGKNRDGASATFSQLLDPGTQMNFVLAVDKNCSSKDQEGISIDDDTYNHYHYALELDAEKLAEMTEGTYAMIEDYDNQAGKWRIAFEDQNFYSETQYLDIKQNGYGNSKWNSKKQTWGGNGWDHNSLTGLRTLEDYGSQPDYSDQVFWVELVPFVSDEEDPAACAIADAGDTGDDTGETGDDSEGDGNNGHGNNEDGVDSSNPGQGDGGPNGEVDESCDGTGECIDDETR